MMRRLTDWLAGRSATAPIIAAQGGPAGRGDRPQVQTWVTLKPKE